MQVALVDSSFQITLTWFQLFPCSLKHSVLILGERRKENWYATVNKWEKWERAVWQQKNQGRYSRVIWKPPVMWMASPVKRAKGDKQAETASWGQEFSSHLKTIKQQQQSIERPHISMQEHTENDRECSQAPEGRPKILKRIWAQLSLPAFRLIHRGHLSLHHPGLARPTAQDSCDSCWQSPEPWDLKA